MTPSVLRPGVTGVEMALILDQEVVGLQGIAQPPFQSRLAVCCHGRTLLNGFTTTRS